MIKKIIFHMVAVVILWFISALAHEKDMVRNLKNNNEFVGITGTYVGVIKEVGK